MIWECYFCISFITLLYQVFSDTERRIEEELIYTDGYKSSEVVVFMILASVLWPLFWYLNFYEER